MPSISARGARFIASHEGTVTRAYRCPAGVITIGRGFTMRSKAFADWWTIKRGRALRMGDTMTLAEIEEVFPTVINSEYGAAVTRKLGPQPQHCWDGATSVAFNCGPGALDWRWSKALAAGDVTGAARLLRTTATTANGRQLPGLVRRRKDEARLIETGNYGPGLAPAQIPPAVSADPADVKWYQERLAKLGYAVKVDGKAATSSAAVRQFQADNKLVVDGIVGPATRATIIRKLDAKMSNKAAAGGATAGGAGGTGGEVDPAAITDETMLWIVLGAVALGALVFGAIWLWRNRGRFTGRRIPT